MALPMLLAALHGRELGRASGAASPSPRSKVILVAPYYGNGELVPHFLDYYSLIGVDEFVFLDLSSRQDLAERVPAGMRVAIWRPHSLQSLAPAIHWLNFLRRRYATGRWCLSVEPTDYFAFPGSDTRHLRDLVEFLDNEGRNHIYALRLIMYGEEAAAEAKLNASDPLKALPYFDALGYICWEDGPFKSAVTRGGVERRALFPLEPVRAPAVQRIPLVKWERKFNYIASTRLLSPRRLNTAHAPWHLCPTACLLSCVLMDDEAQLAVAENVERSAFYIDQDARSYPGVPRLRLRQLKDAVSVRFSTSDDLLRSGLLSAGQWF
jgi:hypothetical protein